MFKFEDNRINELQITDKKFKYPIPFITIKPKNQSESTVVFLFVGGIGSTNSLIKWMNFSIYDNHWLVSYEKAGHGANKNKPSQFRYLPQRELDIAVQWVKKQFPNKKIYLLGESWGCHITFLYYKKHPQEVSGLVNWNCPFKVIDDSNKRSVKDVLDLAIKHVITLLFNIPFHTKIKHNNQEFFSDNKMFQRVTSFENKAKNTTKISLNVWRGMGPTYRIIKANGKNKDLNFLYIQSGDDILCDQKLINKLKNNYCDDKHILLLSSGKHVLSFETKDSAILYDAILKFINK